MSITAEHHDDKKWRGYTNLQSALSRIKLADHHYGYSSAHYNKFESLSDLLSITLLVLDNMDQIPSSDHDRTLHEIYGLRQELHASAEMLLDLSARLKDQAGSWGERMWRSEMLRRDLE